MALQLMGRILMVAAVLGYTKWIGYAWDTPYLNYPDSDPTDTAQAINDVHVNVARRSRVHSTLSAAPLRYNLRIVRRSRCNRRKRPYFALVDPVQHVAV
jgi:hypothetical protein